MGGPFVKGQSGNPAGRPPGTPNKVTIAAREFLTKLVEDPKIQRKVRNEVLAGNLQAFLKAVDKIVPDPPRELKVQGEMRMIAWPDNEDIAE